MLSRRDFLKLGAAAGTGMVYFWRGGTLYARSSESLSARPVFTLPGGTLDPLSVPKYQTPMLIPPAMPTAGKIKNKGGKNADYYEISVKQFEQQILPAGMPPTTVWGYGAVAADKKKGLLLHNAPSLTIEAQAGRPVVVKWINDLVDGSGNYSAPSASCRSDSALGEPPGGTDGRDTRPTFT